VGLTAAEDALDNDRKIWDETSAVLQRCAGVAETINIEMSTVSVVSDRVGFTASYTAVQQQVATLTSQGSDLTGKMANTLKTILDDFMNYDLATAEALHDGWDVKG
jgi:hypothetical protein